MPCHVPDNLEGNSKAKEDAVPRPYELSDTKSGDDLMQVEERNTGAVTWITYSKYLRFAGGLWWAPIIILLLSLSEGAQGDLAFV
jgi:hypothetical protein